MNHNALYYFMVPFLLLGGLIQSTAGVRLMVLGVKPDIVLMLILVGSVVYGAKIGIVWAFIGGLILDTFSGGPMGSSSLALIGAAFVAGLGHETLSRFNFFVPLSAAILGTLIYDGLYLSVLAILGRDVAWQATVEGAVGGQFIRADAYRVVAARLDLRARVRRAGGVIALIDAAGCQAIGSGNVDTRTIEEAACADRR